MKDDGRFALRELTEQIFRVRKFITNNSKRKSFNDDEVNQLYDELWRKRNQLEDEIFGK